MSVNTDEILKISGGRFQDFVAKLSPEDRAKLTPHLETRMAESGTVLIQQGDAPSFMLIIEEGALEVLVETHGSEKAPPVSYLGRGDIVGDLGMLTRQRRSATVRTSSPVVFKAIDEAAFKQLMAEIPSFATFFAGRMARLAAATRSGSEHNSICADLGGKLPNFDLLAVFYTIGTGTASGELAVLDDQRNRLGCVFVGEGLVQFARYRHLVGLEACYQMLTEQDLVGSFSFRPEAELAADVDPDCLMELSVNDLLSQAVAIREAMAQVPAHILQLEGLLKILSPEDPGAPEDVRDLNEAIIALCGNEETALSELWERSALSLYHFTKSVHYMCSIGMARAVAKG